MKTVHFFQILTLLSLLSMSAYSQQRDFYIKKKDGSVSKSSQEKRVALVIGNNNYRHTTPLKNPINDAYDMKNMLERLDFEVIYLENGSRNQMIDKVKKFRKKIGGQYSVALFYYAGHGLQLQDDNWLVPVEAKPESQADVEVSCLSLNYLMRNLESANTGVNIIILDACRNNPFKYAGRTTGGGLKSPSNTPAGTFIAFSTAPNQVAADGNGRNSPYTQALLKALPQPNITIERTFKNVRLGLQQNTGQVSWENSSLVGEFYFNPTGGTADKPAKVDNDLDSDGDGIIDRNDECPFEKGHKENLGCPENLNNVEDIFASQMVYIEGGSFEMGTPHGATDAQPVHTVELRNFKMSKYEVTQAQWRKVMRHNPSQFIGCDECPVEQVSHEDVQAFLQKINEQTGKKYRLPTEAEWEYAARGGQQSHAYKYAGSDNLESVAWFSGSVNNKKTQPVGSKAPNELGLYDMSGNVYEWCSDLYGKDFYNSSTSDNPTGPSTGIYNVIRGGAWNNPNSRCEVTYRNFIILPKHKSIGFRLVEEL